MLSLVFSLTFTQPWRASSPLVLGTTLCSAPQTPPTHSLMSTLEQGNSATISQDIFQYVSSDSHKVVIVRPGEVNIDKPILCSKSYHKYSSRSLILKSVTSDFLQLMVSHYQEESSAVKIVTIILCLEKKNCCET